MTVEQLFEALHFTTQRPELFSMYCCFFDQARRTMDRQHVDWLAICQDGVLIGFVDRQQLLTPADQLESQVGALAGRESGRVFWIESPRQ